ncbi:MAG: hypothetical protein Q9166_004943 [cf. Caloplaca sp. 2 TL-2023]
MTSDQKPTEKLILISGINGYIASQIGYDLLKQGIRVRGTTRSQQSADALLRDAYAPYANLVQIVQIPDITVEGAFNEAVKDTTSIIHAASPLSYALTTWSDTVDVATAGSLSILNSALHHAGPQLQAFVLTSSFAACNDPSPAQSKVFTENDWNTWAEAKAKSPEFEGLSGEERARVLYSASKTASERAVWAWGDEYKPPFAITSINPTIVIGPPLQPPPHPDQLNQTLKPVWLMISGQLGHIPRPIPNSAFISLHDVSKMHIYAALNPRICNSHRYLLAAGRAPPQALADVIRKTRPQWRNRIPEGKPGEGYVQGSYGWMEGSTSIDCSRAKEALGFSKCEGEGDGEGGKGGKGKDWMGWEEGVEMTVKKLEETYAGYL